MLAGDLTSQTVGGAEVQQVTLARGLAKRGFRVSMICLDYGQEDQVDVDGIRVHRAYRLDAGVPVLRFLWPRLTSIWACLRRVDADVYYQRTAGMLTGVVASFCRRYRKKSIFAAAGDPWIRFGRDYRIYEYGLRTVDQIVVQTSAQAQHFRDKYGRDSVLMPSCYELSLPRTPEPPAGLVLWVSTIRQLKRPDLFLDLACGLPDYRFRMVGGPGDGERTLYDIVRNRAHEIPNVEFAGFVPYTQVDRHFDAAAVFVNTSDTEGFPNTFLQSWARGIPTVSFIDCEARLNGVEVNLVVKEQGELRAAVARLLQDDAYREARGRVSREYFERVHAPGPILERYEALVTSLMQR